MSIGRQRHQPSQSLLLLPLPPQLPSRRFPACAQSQPVPRASLQPLQPCPKCQRHSLMVPLPCVPQARRRRLGRTSCPAHRRLCQSRTRLLLLLLLLKTQAHLLPDAKPTSSHSGRVKAFLPGCLTQVGGAKSRGEVQRRQSSLREDKQEPPQRYTSLKSSKESALDEREPKRHPTLGSYYLLKEELSVTAGVLVQGIKIMV